MNSFQCKSAVLYKSIKEKYIFIYVVFLFIRLNPLSTIIIPGKVDSIFFSLLAVSGVFIMLIDMFGERCLLKTRYSVLLFMFMVSLLISSLLNIEYGFFNNFKTFIWTGISFFLLYVFNTSIDKKDVIKKIRLFQNMFIIYSFITVLISLIMFMVGFEYSVKLDSGKIIRLGFVENRLFGMFCDPNFISILCIVVIIFSIYNYRLEERKSIRIFYIFNIAIQFFYLILSGSRTGEVSAIVTLALVSVFEVWVYLKAKNISRGLKLFYLVVAPIFVCIIFVLVMNITKIGLTYLPSLIQVAFSNSHDKVIVPANLSREDVVNSTDISNLRFKIWESAFELFKSKPIFGTSPRNMISYAKDKFPNSFIAQRKYMVHNAYIDTLTSTGIVGFIILI